MAENYSSWGLRQLEGPIAVYTYCAGKVSGYPFGQIAEIVKSEDSNLAGECTRVYEICEKLNAKAQALGDAARQSIIEFADATLANEQEASGNVQTSSDNLDTLNNALDGLDF